MKEEPSLLKKLGIFSVVIGELAGFSAVGVGFGYWGYAHWGLPWWGLLLFSCLGLVLGFYRVYRISQKDL